MTIRRRMAATVLAAGAAFGAVAQSSPEAEIAKYREALAAGNPADLWEARGEALWKQKRGPKNASLEACDLGKGPGVVKGAYAEMPRYFADADRVMDLETRLAHCMVTLQGFRFEDATKRVFGAGTNRSDMEALVAYVTSESKGIRMKVSGSHPKEKQAYAMGEKMFFYRGGTHDFACATCHGGCDCCRLGGAVQCHEPVGDDRANAGTQCISPAHAGFLTLSADGFAQGFDGSDIPRGVGTRADFRHSLCAANLLEL